MNNREYTGKPGASSSEKLARVKPMATKPQRVLYTIPRVDN